MSQPPPLVNLPPVQNLEEVNGTFRNPVIEETAISPDLAQYIEGFVNALSPRDETNRAILHGFVTLLCKHAAYPREKFNKLVDPNGGPIGQLNQRMEYESGRIDRFQNLLAASQERISNEIRSARDSETVSSPPETVERQLSERFRNIKIHFSKDDAAASRISKSLQHSTKFDIFTGEDMGLFSRWVNKLISGFRLMKPTEHNACLIAMHHLTGRAAELASNLPEHVRLDNLDVLLTHLDSLFNATASQEVSKNLLSTFVQREDMSVQDYALSLEHLHSRAYPNDPCHTSVYLKDKFISGLISKEIQTKLRTPPTPANYRAAYEDALALSAAHYPEHQIPRHKGSTWKMGATMKHPLLSKPSHEATKHTQILKIETPSEINAVKSWCSFHKSSRHSNSECRMQKGKSKKNPVKKKKKINRTTKTRSKSKKRYVRSLAGVDNGEEVPESTDESSDEDDENDSPDNPKLLSIQPSECQLEYSNSNDHVILMMSEPSANDDSIFDFSTSELIPEFDLSDSDVEMVLASVEKSLNTPKPEVEVSDPFPVVKPSEDSIPPTTDSKTKSKISNSGHDSGKDSPCEEIVDLTDYNSDSTGTSFGSMDHLQVDLFKKPKLARRTLKPTPRNKRKTSAKSDDQTNDQSLVVNPDLFRSAKAPFYHNNSRKIRNNTHIAGPINSDEDDPQIKSLKSEAGYPFIFKEAQKIKPYYCTESLSDDLSDTEIIDGKISWPIRKRFFYDPEISPEQLQTVISAIHEKEPNKWDKQKVEQDALQFYTEYFCELQNSQDWKKKARNRIRAFNTKVTRAKYYPDTQDSITTDQQRLNLEAKLRLLFKVFYDVMEDVYTFKDEHFMQTVHSTIVIPSFKTIQHLFVHSRCRTCRNTTINQCASERRNRFDNLLFSLSKISAFEFDNASENQAFLVLERTQIKADEFNPDRFSLGFSSRELDTYESFSETEKADFNSELRRIVECNNMTHPFHEFRGCTPLSLSNVTKNTISIIIRLRRKNLLSIARSLLTRFKHRQNNLHARFGQLSLEDKV